MNLREKRASLTLEATLVLPIFIFAIMMLVNLFRLVRCGEIVAEGTAELAEVTSGYGLIIEDVKDFTGDAEGYLMLLSDLGIADEIMTGVDSLYFSAAAHFCFDNENLMQNGVPMGTRGLDFYGSKVLDSEGYTDVICSCDVSLTAPLFGTYDYTLKNRVKMLSFKGIGCESRFEEIEISEEDGEAEEEPGEEYVYITETGRVYHKTQDCYHLSVTKKAVKYSDVPSKRNEAGAKYYACEHCCNKIEPGPADIVYITTDGNRYHIRPDCPGLKRTIMKVKKSEVGSRRPCKTCYD